MSEMWALLLVHLTPFIRAFFQLITHPTPETKVRLNDMDKLSDAIPCMSLSFGHSHFVHKSQVDNNRN